MILRPYEAADEGQLVDAWFDGWRSNRLDDPTVTRAQLAARVPRELAGRWTVTVAEDDGVLLGFLALALVEGRLDQLFVRPEFHRHGVGAALFEAARAQLPAGFWLHTHPQNHRARRFYERRGMVLDRIEPGPGGGAIYVMPASRA